MDIRRLTSADWEAFRTIRLEALEQAPEAFATDVDEERHLSAQDWSARLAGGDDSFMTGAFAAGKLIGVAGFFRERRQKIRHIGNIRGVYVSPDHRGQGVARELLTAIITEARSRQGVEQIRLTVVTENAPARDLYRKLGFRVFGEEPRVLKLGDRYLDEVHMVLFLS